MIATACAASAQAERPAPRFESASAQASPADTLRYTVRAGETLIVALPPRAAGREVRYEVEEAPALSWLVDRSFMWRTLRQERGTLPVRFRRHGGAGGTDALVLIVEVTP